MIPRSISSRRLSDDRVDLFPICDPFIFSSHRFLSLATWWRLNLTVANGVRRLSKVFEGDLEAILALDPNRAIA